jgi:pimeloyl-ACP methyl ester carboxylesterase
LGKGIATYIKNNKIEKPVIIGHSMGGGLAMAIAADYPELVGKIVIVILYLAWQHSPT